MSKLSLSFLSSLLFYKKTNKTYGLLPLCICTHIKTRLTSFEHNINCAYAQGDSRVVQWKKKSFYFRNRNTSLQYIFQKAINCAIKHNSGENCSCHVQYVLQISEKNVFMTHQLGLTLILTFHFSTIF